MEPVTHLLTGACLARTGSHRRVAYATAAMAIAAEFPDIDTVWSLRGPVSGFEHHRGITHTFLGVPFEAAFLLFVFMAFNRWRQCRKGATASPRPQTPKARVRWGALYGLLILALLSHILLDYTNNYGVRPFFPFNPHWYAGSIVFIFDPLLFLILIAGLLLPHLFALVSSEVAGRRQGYVGSTWAIVALLLIFALWLGRAFEHQKAVDLAQGQTLRAPAADVQPADPGDRSDEGAAGRPLLTPVRSLANPDPFSPFRWYTVTDFGPTYQLATLDTRLGTTVAGRLLNKSDEGLDFTAAKQSRLGRVYLDWSPMPWLQAEADSGEQPGTTQVLFRDPRYMGSLSFLQRQGADNSPLTGIVLLDSAHHVTAEGMDGKFEP